ncbi:MAG TPA: hypothetical protein VMB71_01390 [Acetobacteraceae bacterium]|nr:hypothetical protein [Acetobacteraceae bacterium]
MIGPEMRAARRALAEAGDAQVLGVLRYVDALPNPGEADALLAPLRPRLRHLRPPRPLRFARVLFTPLDPVIVSPAGWQAGAPLVPRSAIHPIATQVRQALPERYDEIQAVLGDDTLAEAVRLRTAGRKLWPDAARVLRSSPVPAEWRATGLPLGEYRLLADAIAICLDAAAVFDELDDPAIADDEVEKRLATLMREGEKQGAAAWGMVRALAMQRFPLAEAPRAAARGKVGREWQDAAATVAATNWAWIEADMESATLGDAAQAAENLHRQIMLLDVLGHDATQRQRAAAAKVKLRESSARRFAAAVKERVTLAMPDMAEDALDGLETEMRDLRLLDAETRRLGPAPGNDAALHGAAAAVTAREDITLMERARLVELLLGAEAGLAVLLGR